MRQIAPNHHLFVNLNQCSSNLPKIFIATEFHRARSTRHSTLHVKTRRKLAEISLRTWETLDKDQKKNQTIRSQSQLNLGFNFSGKTKFCNPACRGECDFENFSL